MFKTSRIACSTAAPFEGGAQPQLDCGELSTLPETLPESQQSEDPHANALGCATVQVSAIDRAIDRSIGLSIDCWKFS